MINRKDTPVGIDFKIDQLQNHIYEYLGYTNYESYPRAYKNRKDNSIIPEFYIGGKSKNYKEVLFDDTYDATSFFLSQDEREVGLNTELTQDVSFIFQCKLEELFPSVLHRADEEVDMNLFDAIGSNQYGFEVKRVVTGNAEKVYRDLKIDIVDAFQDDISNFHVVRFDLSVDYVPNCCC